MTPKEKAIELRFEYWRNVDVTGIDARQCALIAVDEILKVTAPIIDRFEPYYQELSDEMTQNYWQQVKQELQNL